ncbi:MAG: hypothetical protein NTV34_21490 [Proteobacteria bacterium]|nr:hypothetical protein [Pseudomonadota bacterium]
MFKIHIAMIFLMLFRLPPCFGKGLESIVAPASENIEDVPEEDSVTPPAKQAATLDEKANAEKAPGTSPQGGAIKKSGLSEKLSGRLAVGMGVGIGKMRPSMGTWEGSGVSTVFTTWKIANDPGSRVFATARYMPFAGIWEVERRYYDTTFHGLFFGGSFLMPIEPFNATFKAGLELGYLVPYLRSQDGEVYDSRLRAGKMIVSNILDLNWTILDKTQFGPFLYAAMGGTRIIQGGVQTSFIF